jgi:hypothetical protein
MLLLGTKEHQITKPEIEQVQQEKKEYYFLGSFIRKAGLKLFAYNYQENFLYEVNIKYSTTIHIVPLNNELVPIDYEAAKCMIDSRHEVFEALNLKTATERIKKYKNGKIKTLCNLRKPNPNALNITLF